MYFEYIMSPLAVQKWRWDQGRLTYFQFENIKLIAQCLEKLEGADINQEPDPLRAGLMASTGLPFSPSHYKVWRNYKRVFECAFLASNIDNHLYVSDFCRRRSVGRSGRNGC